VIGLLILGWGGLDGAALAVEKPAPVASSAPGSSAGPGLTAAPAAFDGKPTRSPRRLPLRGSEEEPKDQKLTPEYSHQALLFLQDKGASSMTLRSEAPQPVELWRGSRCKL
jgi:hypothetical protein